MGDIRTAKKVAGKKNMVTIAIVFWDVSNVIYSASFCLQIYVPS